VFFEAPHRIVGTLGDMARTFGGARRALLGRELTKTEMLSRHAGELLALVAGGPTARGIHAVVEALAAAEQGDLVLLPASHCCCRNRRRHGQPSPASLPASRVPALTRLRWSWRRSED
jgi:hypothetical protein